MSQPITLVDRQVIAAGANALAYVGMKWTGTITSLITNTYKTALDWDGAAILLHFETMGSSATLDVDVELLDQGWGNAAGTHADAVELSGAMQFTTATHANSYRSIIFSGAAAPTGAAFAVNWPPAAQMKFSFRAAVETVQMSAVLVRLGSFVQA